MSSVVDESKNQDNSFHRKCAQKYVKFQVLDSSDDENTEVKQAIDQSPGAVKRLFHGGAGTMGGGTSFL